MVKKRKKSKLKGIKGSSKVGWRIRDEYFGRQGLKGYGKSHRGGYYRKSDPISKWGNKKLLHKFNLVYGDS